MLLAENRWILHAFTWRWFRFRCFQLECVQFLIYFNIKGYSFIIPVGNSLISAAFNKNASNFLYLKLNRVQFWMIPAVKLTILHSSNCEVLNINTSSWNPFHLGCHLLENISCLILLIGNNSVVYDFSWRRGTMTSMKFATKGLLRSGNHRCL